MPFSPRASPVPVGGPAGPRSRALTASAPVLAMIGNTPLLPVTFIPEGVTRPAKCGFANSGGSIKDRFALCVPAKPKQRGQLRRDLIVPRCTGGNTGISPALTGVALGYRVRLVMPRSACGPTRRLARRHGAEIQFYDADHERGRLVQGKKAAEDDRFFLPRQFTNPLNARGHEENTAVEITSQMGGEVDAFACGTRNGATLCGAGRALPAGILSGANAVTALRVAARLPCGARVVTVLSDRVERRGPTPPAAWPAERHRAVAVRSPVFIP